MLCPLCNRRKARRACPALGRQICSVCCGTKRLVEIACTSNCVYLASAREHPASAVLRRQEHDFQWLVGHMRDLNERQSHLFFAISSFLATYKPDDLHVPIDQDVAAATGALAATLETSVRGVIYEHRAESLPASRLADALKPVLNEIGQGAGTAFERDAAVVLRRVEQAARAIAKESEGNQRAFLELLARVVRRRPPQGTEPSPAEPPQRSRLILP